MADPEGAVIGRASTTAQPSQNAPLLEAIGGLSKTTKDAANETKQAIERVMKGSPGGGGQTVGGSSAGGTAAVFMGDLANIARSQSGSSESNPPNVPPPSTSVERSAQAEEQANLKNQNEQVAPDKNGQESLQALTWQELGNIGGPLGRFKTQTYANRQYARAASGIGASLQTAFSNIDPSTGQTAIDPSTGLPVESGAFKTFMNNATNNLAPAFSAAGTVASKLAPAATIGQAAYLVGSGWSQAGRDLGYGNAQTNAGFLGFHNPLNILGQQGEQGRSLAIEQQTLMGRNPWGQSVGPGMTEADAKATVQTLAGQGFSNQNGVSGDNTNIAENLVKPLVNQGVSVAGATQWTVALRNSNTSISQLMSSLGNLGDAAKATKETTDTYNASLLKLAETQVSMGGTVANAAAAGKQFTDTTGLDPGVLSGFQQSPIYQGMMIAQNNVLPSGITDLTPGAQMQGMLSSIQLMGGTGFGHGGAFANLDQNKTEGTGSIKAVSAYGSQLEASQIASMYPGVDQSQIQRLMIAQQGGHLGNVINTEKALGSNLTGGINPQTGQMEYGSGIWSLLSKGNAQSWNQLSKVQQSRATEFWNQNIQGNLNDLQLHPGQIKALNATKNIRQRASLLQKDLGENQKNNPQNQIKVEMELKGAAAKHLQFAQNQKSIFTVIANAGGKLANNVLSTPLGAAVHAAGGTESLLSGAASSLGL